MIRKAMREGISAKEYSLTIYAKIIQLSSDTSETGIKSLRESRE